MRRRRLVEWTFRHYLRIAAPDAVGPAPAPTAVPEPLEQAAA
jgi:hypothetical protein